MPGQLHCTSETLESPGLAAEELAEGPRSPVIFTYVTVSHTGPATAARNTHTVTHAGAEDYQGCVSRDVGMSFLSTV